MADFIHNIVTASGRALIARSIASRAKIEFVRMELGDGYAPADSSVLIGLVQKKIEISVNMVSQPSAAACLVSGMFKENTILEGFFAREIGVFARLEGEEEAVLVVYANAGEKADYIPDGNAASLIEEVFNVTILTGEAKVVLQAFDPNCHATIAFVEETIEGLDIDKVKTAIDEAEKALEKLKIDFDEATKKYVEKDGDTMTGNLTVPRVIGSADMWNGWRILSGFEELNALNVDGASVGASSSIIDIFAKMSTKSRLICDVAELNESFPGLGTLDLQKIQDSIIEADFMDVIGRLWRGVFRGGVWSGWFEISSVPIATVLEFYGSTEYPAPLGFEWPHGQLGLRSDYPRLFAVIGTTCGFTNELDFRFPDRRGVVARGLDHGRMLDSAKNRTLGSLQGDAMRDLKGGINNILQPPPSYTSGIIKTTVVPGFVNIPAEGVGQTNRTSLYFDLAGANIPVDTEFRMKNIAANFIIKV